MSIKNLLSDENNFKLDPLDLSVRLFIDGKNKNFQVYRIPLTELYYNDQNDRIATRISQYKAEGNEPFSYESDEEREKYNSIIEDFIIQSNKEKMQTTRNNIRTVGQKVPG